MKFERCAIPDVILCKPNIFGDDRGYFMETFRQDKLNEFLGFDVDFCQDNESKSNFGVLRGLHFQNHPYTQSKLVRVMQGKVLDVALDMRKGSPHFGKSVKVELSGENKWQLFIPKGFAHGFVVLSEHATFAYKCDNYYMASHDSGIFFNDPNLNIDWKLSTDAILLSDKDKKQPLFKDSQFFDYYKNLY
ncbi:dTDP-4-dehydrorhamnose 3,5-epimerase [Flavimarina sp. Hel_I_48]|uniref:dTDP-4-dehydrorhamnose 3,5-epimerase n=1 Tax=Flavimarina sp. Hel_I_48 TaxID=1392488 RepID=UPI0004DFB718|nr:dTDP-4-dehydrorhamnose 3,5-epimerase [Flavimarina sp. Hel_I_48]